MFLAKPFSFDVYFWLLIQFSLFFWGVDVFPMHASSLPSIYREDALLSIPPHRIPCSTRFTPTSRFARELLCLCESTSYSSPIISLILPCPRWITCYGIIFSILLYYFLLFQYDFFCNFCQWVVHLWWWIYYNFISMSISDFSSSTKHLKRRSLIISSCPLHSM